MLLVILTLLCCLLYLNQIGLPNFVKWPLQEKLRARGLDLEFTRMRWRWGYGIVAENVRFGRINEPASANVSVKQAQVQLDYLKLAHLRLQVKALVLHQGELSWESKLPDEPTRKLSLDNIQTELHLMPGDRWELDHFRAEFAGAHLQLSGTITNASTIRDWKMFQAKTPAPPGRLENRLRELTKTLDRIHFSSTPTLNLDVRGDALDLQSFTIRLNVNTPGADTPWGSVNDALLTLVLLPGSSNVLSHAEVNLEAASARTPWAAATNLFFKLNLLSSRADTNTVEADLNLFAANIETKWSQAGNARFSGQWKQAITNAIPMSGHGELVANQVRSPWATATQVTLTAGLETPDATASFPENWAWWTNLAPYALSWDCDIRQLQTSKLNVDQFACAGEWRAPVLSLNRVSSTLYGGKLTAVAGANVDTRSVSFKAASDFEIKKLAPLLNEEGRRWLTNVSWNHRPQLELAASAVLPGWTNLNAIGWREIRPSLRLDGYADLADGNVRGLQFSSVASHFSYSNLLWRLPDFTFRRAEGEVRLGLAAVESTGAYRCQLHSSIDPQALRPLFQTNHQAVFDMVYFTQPPVIDGELWGRWADPKSLGARGTVAITNFAFRGENVGWVQTGIEYTNLFVLCVAPHAESGPQHATATSVAVDIPARKIYLTNAYGSADPMVICRMIGPHIAAIMEPYHFTVPPSASVEGTIPMHDVEDADLHFDVKGGPFEWWKFKVPQVAGRVDWVGKQLNLRNMQSEFYRGTATGNAEFHFLDEGEARINFDVTATDADLHLLMNDLWGKTNHLEGRLTGRVSITDANTGDLGTVQGRGRLVLRDGLIWDIPVFGILSPVLDGIAPGVGLGSSRAREGSATFVITNGVARSDDLEIRASMMRLQYWGTVDYQSRVQAHAQAELLRDTWVVGRLLSYTLWPVSKIFEYRISGTLHEPKSDPVYFIPKVLLMPFHPLRTLKELAPESSSTTAPTPTR
ncbi:MAG: hypothetical protein ACTHLW_21370 [Verrucomicrobiota bacterium]